MTGSWRCPGGMRFEYLSCTRAAEPFLYEGLGIPEIPSDLACFEEAGIEGATEAALASLRKGGRHVLPVMPRRRAASGTVPLFPFSNRSGSWAAVLQPSGDEAGTGSLAPAAAPPPFGASSGPGRCRCGLKERSQQPIPQALAFKKP
jgi:hypothetical protein